MAVASTMMMTTLLSSSHNGDHQLGRVGTVSEGFGAKHFSLAGDLRDLRPAPRLLQINVTDCRSCPNSFMYMSPLANLPHHIPKSRQRKLP